MCLKHTSWLYLNSGERKSLSLLGIDETAVTESHKLEIAAIVKWPLDQDPGFSIWELKGMKGDTRVTGDKTKWVKYLERPEFSSSTYVKSQVWWHTPVIPAVDR